MGEVEMRRRNVQSNESPMESVMDTIGVMDNLTRFDVFSKVQDDHLQRSQAGGIVTVITSLIIAMLFWTELTEFFAVEIVDNISVDTRINQKLPIAINISFPH